MDPRLEFTFQLLMDATGLPRSEIMDHVFEGDMLDDINQLFLPHMKTKLMWFYQEVEEPQPTAELDPNKPGTSRNLQSTGSRSTTMQQQVTHKKKLFLTDGVEDPLTGTCVYIFRTSSSKQLPEEGFQKDLYCGIVDSSNVGIVTTVERIMEYVFMETLAHPNSDTEDDASNCPMVKNLLLPSLRSFCSVLKGTKESSKENIHLAI
nr:unnamed protein product [Callosobruchus analis]